MPTTETTVLRLAMFWGGLLCFLLLELWRPYRPPSQPKLKRVATNIGLTIINSTLLSLLFGAAVMATSLHVSERGLGFLNLLGLPPWLKLLAAVAFLDFMLYVWHLLNHEMPLLWRFHRVHHSDLNMDVSTATRFHLGELLPSALIKLGLIYLSGAPPLAVIVFETLVVLSPQFHHSSLAISPALERLLAPFIITPSMHRIHHSVKITERNTNYGAILSLWDRVMGTLLTRVDQNRIVIGVGGHFDPARLGLGRLLYMPFTPKVK